MDYEVIIPAAGQGKRMQANKNKLWIELKNKPIIAHTLSVFGTDRHCKQIILPINPVEKDEFDRLIRTLSLPVPIILTSGGSERQYSVHNGLELLSERTDIVLVHDGARPFINHSMIKNLIADAKHYGGSVLAVPVKDTIKQAKGNLVEKTIDRSSLWAIQTPQAFRVSLLKEAHEAAVAAEYLGTDDASLVELIGKKVVITEGNYDNIKITTPEDLYFAEAILEKNKKGVRYD